MKKVSKNLYKIVKSENKNALLRVQLKKGSGFPGVILEYNNIVLIDESTKELTKEQKQLQKELKKEAKKDPTLNGSLTYTVIKVPKGKYQNLPDKKKIEFDNLIGEIFIHAMTDFINSSAKKE